MKGIWPSERVNSQVDWLKADTLRNVSSQIYRQIHIQTLFLTVSCLISVDCSLTPCSLPHSLSLGHLFSSCLHSLTVCSVPFPFFGLSLSSHVSLCLLASEAHKSSSDTSLSWKDRRSTEKLHFSELNSYETI